MNTEDVAGRRTAENDSSPTLKTTRYVLIVGLVLALAACFGSVWVVRAGVLVAIIAAVIGFRFAWVEIARAHEARKQDRLAAEAEKAQTARAYGSQLSAERSSGREVLATMTRHNEKADQRISELNGRIGALRSEISSLKGDNASLKSDLGERNQRITTLTEALADRQAELEKLREVSTEAEVLAMPRHAAGSDAEVPSTDWDALPTAEDLWADGNYPTVVDLQAMVFPTEQAEHKKQA